MDLKYSGEEINSRWNTYGTYRLIICAWMINEMSIVFATTEIAHKAFYIHSLVHVFSVIFIGIPLVYSEICIAQFTNCSIITMWDFCPLLRSVGYGSVYLIILKTLYMIVLTSWYLEYTFYAALDPPPWFTCDDFNSSKCMVKRTNVSVFQHCLEAQNVFNDDCGMKTASFYFFDREIGGNHTMKSLNCLFQWKTFVAFLCMSLVLFVLTLKKEKHIQIAVKLALVYVSLVMFVLFCVALSTSGSWLSSKVFINWDRYKVAECFQTITRGVLSLGTGSGIIVFLSRDVSFRSPATMTSIASSLLSIFVCLMFALIAFSGIKTMSYFHGEEANVIEVGDSRLFMEFASISEILSYFDAVGMWSFAWFSAIFLCLFMNFWILYLFLRETFILNSTLMRNYQKSYSLLFTIILCILALPFCCIDLSSSLNDATMTIQLCNNFFFAVSLYWIYGFRKHAIDIIFMIGVKASYFWKILWICNPILLAVLIYFQLYSLGEDEFDNSYILKGNSMECHKVLFYALMSIYMFIVTFGMIVEIIFFYRFDNIRNILSPVKQWGPRDKVLKKSRQMFVPQIMTTEFLYRQIRIHGYGQKCKLAKRKQNVMKLSQESNAESLEWSAFTSN